MKLILTHIEKIDSFDKELFKENFNKMLILLASCIVTFEFTKFSVKNSSSKMSIFLNMS